MSDDAMDVLGQYLPQATARLMDLARSSDRKVASQAVALLLGYLNSDAAMQRTMALGATAAELHLSALEGMLVRQAELEARGKRRRLARH